MSVDPPAGNIATFAIPTPVARRYRPPEAAIIAHQHLVARRKRSRRNVLAGLRQRKSKR